MARPSKLLHSSRPKYRRSLIMVTQRKQRRSAHSCRTFWPSLLGRAWVLHQPMEHYLMRRESFPKVLTHVCRDPRTHDL